MSWWWFGISLSPLLAFWIYLEIDRVRRRRKLRRRRLERPGFLPFAGERERR